jgi:hypothetical protein
LIGFNRPAPRDLRFDFCHSTPDNEAMAEYGEREQTRTALREVFGG